MAAIEEPVAATELPEAAAGAPAEDKQADDENPTVAKSKKSKEPKAKKVSAPKKPRNTPAHPTYFEMIDEAITTLKERNGSSQYAIQKFIEENHKHLPPNFRKLLLFNLKKLVASDRLVKVKGSYKLPSTRSSAPKADSKPKLKDAAQPKPKPKPKAAAQPKPKAVAAAAPAKPKAVGAKRKAVTDVKPKEKPAKAVKTTVNSTPSKKVVAATKKPVAKKATPSKKALVRSMKARSVRSPVKRAMPKRGRK